MRKAIAILILALLLALAGLSEAHRPCTSRRCITPVPVRQGVGRGATPQPCAMLLSINRCS